MTGLLVCLDGCLFACVVFCEVKLRAFARLVASEVRIVVHYLVCLYIM